MVSSELSVMDHSKNHDRADVSLIKGLIIGSYRFSRGNSGCQEAILRYIGVEVGEQLLPRLHEQAIEPTIEACNRIWKSNKHHPKPTHQLLDGYSPEQVHKDIKHYLAILQAAAQGIEAPVDENNLTAWLLQIDHRWVSGMGVLSVPEERKYESNLIKHSIMGQGTGFSAYDALFAMAKERLPEIVAEPYTHDPSRAQQFGNIVMAHTANRMESKSAIDRYMEAYDIQLVINSDDCLPQAKQ